jgi:methyltransferase (TIGR00027 family)
MIAGTPSRTALGVALRRAAHQLLDHPKVFDDPLAVAIAGGEDAVRAEIAEREYSTLAPFIRAFMAVRSRLAEDELAAAMARGVAQYVVLGAGLDTFAYRQRFASAELRVFEVDHPETQAWKRERLHAAGIAIPTNVVYAEADFRRQSLAGILADAGLAATRPAFFAWLGVTMYLEKPAVFATLDDVAKAARGGGGVVLDYIVDPTPLGPPVRAVFDRLADRVAKAGEPWVSYFTPAEIVSELTRREFLTAEDADGDKLNRRYFADRTDGLRVATLSHIGTGRMK